MSKTLLKPGLQFFENLPKDFKEDELIEMLEEYGIVKNSKIIRDRYTKISRNFDLYRNGYST